MKNKWDMKWKTKLKNKWTTKWKTKIMFVLLLLSLKSSLYAQKIVVGFYNCENFYDTINQIQVIDEDFTPESDKGYNAQRFQQKNKNIANTIYKLGLLGDGNGIAMLGLAEIENRMVLENLVQSPILKKYNYKIIHFDSKDLRGIDVGLIYNPAIFKPYIYKPFSLSINAHVKDFPTRDILYVKGTLYETWVHLLINHWPSRRGGLKQSSQKRIWASTICKNIIDSITALDPKANIIMMGDFNDNPTDKSIKNIPLVNPFYNLFKKGEGSLAFRDSWHLFDQILISNPLFKSNKESKNEGGNKLKYYKSIIYKDFDHIEMNGKYQGYPKRTWDGNEFRGGFSDHFPVAMIFSLKTDGNPLN